MAECKGCQELDEDEGRVGREARGGEEKGRKKAPGAPPHGKSGAPDSVAYEWRVPTRCYPP